MEYFSDENLNKNENIMFSQLFAEVKTRITVRTIKPQVCYLNSPPNLASLLSELKYQINEPEEDEKEKKKSFAFGLLATLILKFKKSICLSFKFINNKDTKQ